MEAGYSFIFINLKNKLLHVLNFAFNQTLLYKISVSFQRQNIERTKK